MASSFFRDLLDQIVERGRVLRAFSLGGDDHGGTISTLSKGLLSGRGESSGMVVARHILAIFEMLDEDEKTAFFRFLNDSLCPDAEAVQEAAAAYLADPSRQALAGLQKSVESPRQEFCRRAQG
ncbi:MAG: malonyl-CoA decarboxylase N-terminal domain-containing protein [Pseudomonadota bacterium]